MQFHRLGEQGHFRLGPLGGVGQGRGRIEDALQAAETTVATQHSQFLICGCTLFTLYQECRPDGVNILLKMFLPIVCHTV